MLENIMSGRKKSILLKTLDAQMARSRVIGNNIANVTTPGYKRREVKFEESLQSALSSSRLKGRRSNGKHMSFGAGHVANVSHEVHRPYDPTLASGVNNVDIDNEMAALAETQITFKFAMKRLSGSYNKLNAAIKGKSMQ